MAITIRAHFFRRRLFSTTLLATAPLLQAQIVVTLRHLLIPSGAPLTFTTTVACGLSLVDVQVFGQ